MPRLEGHTGNGTLHQVQEHHFIDSLKHDSVSNGTVIAVSEHCTKHLYMSAGRAIDMGDPVVPNTLNPICENGTSLFDFKTPSFAVSAHLLNSDCIENQRNIDALDESPRTPEGCMFNPFVPGPDDMVLAPLRKNFQKESRNVVARRLDFDDSPDSATGALEFYDEDEVQDMLMESIYATILEAILLNQTKLFLAEHNHSHNGITGTPLLHPPAIGSGHTCPVAPAKSKPDRRVSKTVIDGLCRKLEF